MGVRFQNPALKVIYEKAVLPALSKRYQDVVGHVIGVHYTEQKVDVRWRDPNSGAFRISKRVPLPKDADGIYRQSVKVGDEVSIAFQNGNLDSPYVNVIYRKEASTSDYYFRYGGGIPKGIGYF